MSVAKVIFINPNPRNMALISPVVSIFHSVFTTAGIEMRFFDTSFYDIEGHANSDSFLRANRVVQPFEAEYERRTKEMPNPSNFTGDLYADFLREVKTFNPDVIMASAMESTVGLALQLLASVRGLGIPHVLGGVFATFAPEKAIRFAEVDMICKGEGEPIIVPLVKKLKAGEDPFGLPGIWTKNADGTINKGNIQAAVNLDDAPRFDVTPFNEKRFYRAMSGKVYRMFPVESHRGCPLKCTFCNSPIQDELYKTETGKRYFRKKSVKKVMEDVKYFVEEQGAEYLFLWADNFLAYSREEIDEFCRAYSEYRIPFFTSSYPTTLDEYKIQRMVDAGLHRLSMGVEHGNETFRREVVNRSYSNDKAIECVKMLRKYPIEYSLNNIVGFPTETPELHWDTVMLNKEFAAHTASCSIFTPFHGTRLRALAIEKGYLEDPELLAPTNSEWSVLNMPQFTKEQIYGKSRTFNLYLKLPENRYKDIKRAEEITPEGDRIWGELKEEYDHIVKGKDTSLM